MKTEHLKITTELSLYETRSDLTGHICPACGNETITSEELCPNCRLQAVCVFCDKTLGESKLLDVCDTCALDREII